MSSATIPVVEETVFEALWPYKRQGEKQNRWGGKARNQRRKQGGLDRKPGGKNSSKTQRKNPENREGRTSQEPGKKTEAGREEGKETELRRKEKRRGNHFVPTEKEQPKRQWSHTGKQKKTATAPSSSAPSSAAQVSFHSLHSIKLSNAV
jgi:hypothetical protein